MSMQVTIGPGSLVALGISIGDVATLYGLGRRLGNWLTAASGDQDLLNLLDQDEMSIFQRKGLIDIVRFNKLWNSRMALLANGGPAIFTGKSAEMALETLPRFTAIMVCVIAALDAFVPLVSVKSVIKAVLLELLRTSEYGEDVLVSQYNNRVNSWRSAADVRGLTSRARQTRQRFLKHGTVLDGLMPIGDSPLMVHFLVWLLAGQTHVYVTPSSDVAGVGSCLSELGVDILSVQGLGEEPVETPCRLEFSPEAVFHSSISNKVVRCSDYLSRVVCTTVSLTSPEESLTNFPVDIATANRCRAAWKAGQRAAAFVDCLPLVTATQSRGSSVFSQDLRFVIYSKGSEPVRTSSEIEALASANAFVVNGELQQGLEQVFKHESISTLEWLYDQTTEAYDASTQVFFAGFNDQTKINAFTVFQAFFMGYYYGIFLRLVDTSTLQLQTVDGSWGFRSAHFLCRMRTQFIISDNACEPGIFILRREDVISILSSLLFSSSVPITRIKRETAQIDSWCLGVVGKRALLVRSLISPCRSIRDIGSFILLDVDVSGIPTDQHGLVRPSQDQAYRDCVEDQLESGFSRLGIHGSHPEHQSAEDVSFHIEPSWDVDPETMLLCVRYRGRRVTTINPAVADLVFCHAMMPPVAQPIEQEDAETLGWTVQDCLIRRRLPSNDQKIPYLMCIPGRPRLQYASLYWYCDYSVVRLATNCLHSAIQHGKAEAASPALHNPPCLVISRANTAVSNNSWVPENITQKIRESERIVRPKRNTFVTPLGDLSPRRPA